MKQRLLYGFLLLFVCMTGSIRAWALEPDAEGVYQIGTAQDLIDFAAVVNDGEFDAKAVLTADIILTDLWETPIGVISGDDNGNIGPAAFTGIFDGQGHKITGFDAESTGHGGLFGDANGATIKNFSIWGKLQVYGGHGSGVIAYLGNSTITGVHSYLEIDVPDAGACHVGGVVGSARGGNTITGCTFNGTMTIAAGNADCFGGIVGYGGDNISFCANYGTITFDERGCYAGGITGYLNSANTYVRNCLNMGSLVYNYPENAEESEKTPKYGSAIVGRLRGHDLAKMTGNCWLEGSARGAGINDSGVDDLAQALCFTSDKLAIGEVCYALNGDQSEIGWYQTLNADEVPVLDATHAQVYKNGHKHCNGTWYEGYIYSNTFSEAIQDDHNMVDGVCDYCGFIDWDAITNSIVLNDDGFYEIANGPQLMWFAKYVNDSHPDANAILTANIDLSKVVSGNPWAPIGSGTDYIGTFDGKGFTISNFNVTSDRDYYGLFGKLAGGAVVKNFTIDGTLISLNQYVGVIGGGGGGTINVSDIHSKLNITCSKSRHAGVFGFQSSTGTINVDRCIYSGTLDAGSTSGNLGGIFALTQNSTGAYVNITDCLFDGTILDEGGSNAGGILGYANKTRVTIKNCLSVGTVIANNPSPFIGQLNASNSKWAGNNYYTTEGAVVGLPGSGVTVAGTEPVETTESQLESGEICWDLNEGQFIDVAWRQTIEMDPYPMPTGNGDCVYLFSMGIENINSDNIAELINNVIADETDFIEDDELVAYNVLINEYKEAIQSWETIDNYNDFVAAYKASVELKESIMKSAASYEKYVQACENTSSYIEENNLEGAWTDFLVTYLEEDVEPDSDYPNGSYSYIMDSRNLDDEAIAAEIAFVNQMLEMAIAGGLIPGTEITRLMKNTDFTEGEDHFEGWTTESEEGVGFATGGDTSTMRIARGLGKGSFNISQTLNELPNGVYMMAVNGMFRSGADVTDQFYAGQIYLNGTANYVMSPGEDVVLEENAEPGVNCLGEGSDKLYDYNGIVGWVPNGMGGCPVAYGAGRYQNFCATEVTDGTLTVGVRSLGTGLASDWLPFGNLHVYYLGTPEDANEKLSDVLDGFVARAQVIVDFESSDGLEGSEDAARRPNISEELKDQLSDAIDAVAEATTGEKKMALINTFSALFAEVHTCRKTYIRMYEVAEKLANLLENLYLVEIIDDDELETWNDYIVDVYDNFAAGTVTTEEALASIEKMSFADQLMPQVDGIYQLSTAKQLQLFSIFVNGGQANLKAVLTNDIDMSELDFFDPIGSSSNPFTGEFDGQGFKITGFGQYDEEEDSYTLSFSSNAQGFFGSVKDASIKNFSIDGKIEITEGKYIGAIGQAVSSTISNVHSYLDINVTASGVHHTAGVVGSTEGGSNTTITGCSYSGNMTIAAGSTDNFAGVVGYLGGDNVIDCANYGTITFKDAGCAAGGVAGYLNNTSTYIQNCLNVGAVYCDVSDSPKYGGAIVGRIKSNWSSEKIVNNYWQEGTAYGPAKKDDGSSPAAASSCTDKQLASGEICFKLNGNQEEIVWFQTLTGEDKDLYPVLDSTHKVVLYTDELGYHNEGDDEDAIETVSVAPETGNQVIYNLAGQRVSKLQKGINIVGTKKILVK